MTNILFVLGSNIKKYRKNFGWTQAYLAEKSGISVPFMTQIELGRKSASLEVVQSIASALNVSYEQLFDENSATSEKQPNLVLLEKQLSESVLRQIHKEFCNFL